MANVVYSINVSLDGFFETKEGALDWAVIDEEWFPFINARQAAVGAYLYGRRLYENMAAYWTTPQANDPANAPEVLEWARIWLAMPKVVFSNTLESVSWNSRLVRGDAAAEVARMRALPGKDLAVGGAALAASLIRQDLVDVYELFVHPVILGSGKPALPPLERRLDLELVESRTFPGGLVHQRYERRTSAAPRAPKGVADSRQ